MNQSFRSLGMKRKKTVWVICPFAFLKMMRDGFLPSFGTRNLSNGAFTSHYTHFFMICLIITLLRHSDFRSWGVWWYWFLDAGDIERNWPKKYSSRLPINVCCDGCFYQSSSWILHPSLAEAEQINGGSITGIVGNIFFLRFWTGLLSLIR